MSKILNKCGPVIILFFCVGNLIGQMLFADEVRPISSLADPEPSVGSQALGIASEFALSANTLSSAGSVEIVASAVLNQIEVINMDTNLTNTGVFQTPPNTQGAVGPAHFITAVNSSIEWRTKTGVLEQTQALGKNASGSITGSFFESLTPVNTLFDPKIIYDQHVGRFVIVTLERQDMSLGDPVNSSRILVAVSASSDPNAGWHFLAIDSLTVFGNSSAWADFPNLAVDEEAIYITSNLFSFGTNVFQGNRVWIIAKGAGTNGLYEGGIVSFNVHDPIPVGSFTGTLQPAHVFGATGVPGTAAGTFLVSYGGLSNGTQEFLQVIRIDSPLTQPVFTAQFVGVGSIDDLTLAIADAQQFGSATLIDSGDRRTSSAVWRNNSLWVASTIIPNSLSDLANAGQTTAHWWELDTSTLTAITVVQQGNVGGEDIDIGAFTFYPAIAVDMNNNMAINFAVSSPNIFPGAALAGRNNADPLGALQAETHYSPGEDTFVRTFGATTNRWGEYYAMAVDPSDDLTLCALGEHSLIQGLPDTSGSGELGRWGNTWACVSFDIPVCHSDFNADLVVNITDFIIFRNAFGTVPGDVGYVAAADINNDGFINISDFIAFRNEFGRTDCPVM